MRDQNDGWAILQNYKAAESLPRTLPENYPNRTSDGLNGVVDGPGGPIYVPIQMPVVDEPEPEQTPAVEEPKLLGEEIESNLLDDAKRWIVRGVGGAGHEVTQTLGELSDRIVTNVNRLATFQAVSQMKMAGQDEAADELTRQYAESNPNYWKEGVSDAMLDVQDIFMPESLQKANAAEFGTIGGPRPGEEGGPRAYNYPGFANLAEAITQFAAGAVPFAKAVKLMGVQDPIARGLVWGYLADFAAMDPDSGLMTDMLTGFLETAPDEERGPVAEHILDMIMYRSDDPALVKRAKMAYEGFVVGLAAEGAMKLPGATKGLALATAAFLKSDAIPWDEIGRFWRDKSGTLAPQVGDNVPPADDLDDLGFYSAIHRHVSGLKQEKFKGQDLLNQLRGGKVANIKEEEIKWLGLDRFLEGKNKVTKQEILDYIDENTVKFEERHLRGQTIDDYGVDESNNIRWQEPEVQDSHEHWVHIEEEMLSDFDKPADGIPIVDEYNFRDVIDAMSDLYPDRYPSFEFGRGKPQPEWLQDLVARLREGGRAKLEGVMQADLEEAISTVAHAQYMDAPYSRVLTQDVGGVPYEIFGNDEGWQVMRNGAQINTSPISSLEEAKIQAQVDATEQGYIADAGYQEAKFQEATLPGGENYREILMEMDAPSYRAAREGSDKQDQIDGKASFTGGHYSDVSDNLAVHWRVSDRKVYSRELGRHEDVLYVDEIQSDWNIIGSKRGFHRPITDDELSQLQDLTDKSYIAGQHPAPPNAPIIQEPVRMSPKDRRDLDRLHRQKEASDRYEKNHGREAYDSQPDAAPFVEDVNKYMPLAVRRLLRYAAEKGYDRVAWPKGWVHAKRYNLERDIAAVRVVKNDTVESLGAGRSRYDVLHYSPSDVARARVREAGQKLAEPDNDALLKKIAQRNSLSGRINSPMREGEPIFLHEHETIKPYLDALMDNELTAADRQRLATRLVDIGDVTDEEMTKLLGISSMDDYAPGGFLGRERNAIYEKVTEESMREILGDDLTDKVLEGLQGKSAVKLGNLDLKIGGDFRKQQYDKILPRAFQTHAQKFNKKVRVETSNLDVPVSETERGRGGLDSPSIITDDDPALEVWSIQISPEMRESIMQRGVPLYSAAPIIPGAIAAGQQEQPAAQ